MSKTNPIYKAHYKTFASQYKKAVKEHHKQMEFKIASSNNRINLYKYMNKKLNVPQSLPPMKLSDGKLVIESTQKADLFNSTFSSVFIKDNGLQPTVSQFSASAKHNVMPNFSVFPTDVYEAISNLKNSTSRSPDSIPAIFLKKAMQPLLKPLSMLYNISLSQSKVPQLWKRALVIPIHKKGLHNLTTNYRPISLTSNICRVLERIIHKKLSSHLLKNNLITDAQHGFIHHRSTLTQHFHLLDKLTDYQNKKKATHMVYLDFSKAFDRVSHTKLIYTLQYYNVNTAVISWLKDYLNGRSQTTVVDNFSSKSLQICSGVPQGSVLGPLLFTLYIEDLIRVLKNTCQSVSILAFADDLKLMSNHPTSLQEALNVIDNWTTSWQLPIQPTKSENITFVFGHPGQYDLSINGADIPKVDVVKDLGISIASDLKWIVYISQIKRKADNLCSLVLRSFQSNHLSNYLITYKTYIRPLLEYNTSIWNPFLISDIKLIESVQRRFTRIVCNRLNLNFSSYSERLTILELESLEIRRVKFDLILLYKILHKLIYIDFESFFTINRFSYNLRRHNLSLRGSDPHKSRIRSNFFAHRVINVWNKLPESLVNSPTLTIFKSNLNRVDLKELCSLVFK